MSGSLGESTYAAIVEARREALRGTCGELFSTTDRFVWEIGCGHGHFLAAYGAAHPGSLCVGIDIESERIARAERKRRRARLDNVRFIRADAADFLASLPERVRFSAAYVLFPDPWPKRRHRKNRLVTDSWIRDLAARAAGGARLYLRTDYEPYFEEARSLFAACPAWRLVDEPWPFEAPTVFQARARGHRSLTAAAAAGPEL